MKKLTLLFALTFLVFINGFALSQEQEKVIRWQEGTEYSDTLLVQGNTCRTITFDGITVLSNIYYTDKFIRVDVLVDNNTKNRINVDPSTITLTVLQPKAKNLKYKSPEEIAKSINKKAALNNIFAGLGGMATKQTTTNITDERGFPIGSATTTTPDYEARRRAEETQRKNRENANDAITYINSIVLRANTVFPGHNIIGAVFFEKEKKIEEGILSIPIGKTTFEFSYATPKK